MNQHDHKCRGCKFDCDCGGNTLDCKECFRCKEQARFEQAENQCGCGFYTNNTFEFNHHLEKVHTDENGEWIDA
jgi:hypothetical protein